MDDNVVQQQARPDELGDFKELSTFEESVVPMNINILAEKMVC
jgi:hypothetical protein